MTVFEADDDGAGRQNPQADLQADVQTDVSVCSRPGSPEIVRAAAPILQSAISRHRHGRLREAEELYRAALQLDESDFEGLHNLGLLLAQQGRFGEAAGPLRAAVRQDPRSVEAHNNLGNVLAITGHHDEAVASYRNAIALKADHAEAHNNLGNVLALLGRYEQAVASYRNAIAVKPNYAEACHNIGYALARQGKTDEAMAQYRRVLALKPDYAEPHVSLGDLLQEQGRLDEAVVQYRQALAISPHSPAAYHALGKAVRQQGSLAEARACFERVLALKPDHAEAHCNLGTVLSDQREFGAAMACFERALELQRGLAEAWLGLGHVLQQAKRYDDALAAYDKAPALAEAWLGRALALQRLSRTTEAIIAYRHALAEGCDAEVVLYNLASLGAAPAPLATPRRIVTKAYDRQADHYDQDHAGARRYRTPELLFDAVTRFVPAGKLDIVDLGCGTGLLGARIHPLARTLAGVDLSSKMLGIARQRRIYDSLVCGDLIELLVMRAGHFDLAVAADVLVYIGDLSGVFRGARNALRHRGIFGFSLEAGGTQDFALRPNLRYAHSLAYIQKLSEDHGFVLEMIESKVTRQENGADVVGYVAVLRRS
jgi:predicted TPR repeat methyltransferase